MASKGDEIYNQLIKDDHDEIASGILLDEIEDNLEEIDGVDDNEGGGSTVMDSSTVAEVKK